MTEYAITPDFRASWPKVFTPEKNDLNGKMEYTVDALFPKGTDLTPLKKLAERAALEKFPHGLPANFRSPFRDGSEKVQKDKNTGQVLMGPDGLPQLQPGFERGATFIKLKTEQRPGIVGPDNVVIIDAAQVYGGCWLRAQVHCYAYSQKGNSGVSFGLDNIQKLRDDEPLSGRVKAENAFQPVAQPGASTPASGASIFG